MSEKITIDTLNKLKSSGEKFTCLTAYDASFARLEDEAGVEIVLVGDSLGMVLHGEETTQSVTIQDMVYHTRIVSKACQRAMVISDMPYKSYTSPSEALKNAKQLITEGKADVVKLEGGAELKEIVSLLKQNNISVCGHLGLLPQSINNAKDYQVQATTRQEAEKLHKDALSLQQAGVELLVLECIPANVATDVTNSLNIPVIGIGAGSGCDAQVLVIYDMLGMNKKQYKFSKNFLAGENSISNAIKRYIHDVKNLHFPAKEHTFE